MGIVMHVLGEMPPEVAGLVVVGVWLGILYLGLMGRLK